MKSYGKKYYKKSLKNQYLIKYLMIKAGNDNNTLKQDLKKILAKLSIN